MEEMRIHDNPRPARVHGTHCSRGLPHDVTIVDALTEVFVGGVVRKTFELVLDRL